MADLASRIWQARDAGGLLERADADGVADRKAAYAMQAEAAERAGLTRAGWKVAATSGASQELLGVSGPCIGPIFAEHINDSPCEQVARPDQGTAIECEIAFVLGRDLAGGIEVSRDAILDATDHAMVAVEIVGCRFQGGFKGAGETICISDFAFNAGFVRGPAIGNWRNMDLREVAAEALIDGESKAQGTGELVLGDPIEALCWAAGEAARIGMPLKAGDIVSTGTMTGATLVEPGQRAVGNFGPLGKIEIGFKEG